MPKSFFEKLGNSLNLDDNSQEGEEIFDDESPDEQQTPDIPEELSDDFENMPDDEELQDKESVTTLAVSSVKTKGAKAKSVKSQDAKMQAKKISPVKSRRITLQKSDSDVNGQVAEEREEGQLTIDVYEKNDEIVVQSTIAGVNAEDLDIDITSDSVTIRGERKQEEEVKEDNYYYQELYWGAFSRSVILPAEVNPDKATAALKNGVLTIRLPKLTKSQQKKLKVKLE